MFKGLLFIGISLLTIAGYSQGLPQDSLNMAGPATDSADIIFDLHYVVNGNASVMLTWKMRDSMPPFVVIERSDNSQRFETITILNQLTPKPSYQWIDDSPKKGKNLYRIRYVSKEGSPAYSKTISCQMEGYASFKFYPNPVDQILIVRSDTPLDVIISDGNGRVRLSNPKVLGLQTINVSSLEKGIYLIRFSDKSTNTFRQEQLLKN